MLIDPQDPFLRLLRDDKRYRADAYLFLWEALNFAHEELKMGRDRPTEPPENPSEDDPEATRADRHVSGQELCEAARQYALRQYGFMAKTVLNSWGLRSTGDFGEIVYNLIRIGRMRKTPEDRREDFDGQYDFQTAFQDGFEFTPGEGE